MARTPEELVGGLASGAGGGDGGSGVWLGPTRWILPAHSDTAHNLLTVTLEAGGSGRVKQLAAQGRRVPLVELIDGNSAVAIASITQGIAGFAAAILAAAAAVLPLRCSPSRSRSIAGTFRERGPIIGS